MTEAAAAPSQETPAPTVETPQAPVAPQAPQAPEQPPVQAQAQTPPQQPETPPAEPEGEQPQAVERTVPEGKDYQFAAGTPAELGNVFNKLDMTQEQADGVIKLDQVRDKANAEALRTAGEAHVKEWGDQAEGNMNLARRGMSHFDPTGQLKKVLNETGYGNDPRLLEMFYQFGQRMEEGGFLPSEVNTPNQPLSAAQTLYGNQGK